MIFHFKQEWNIRFKTIHSIWKVWSYYPFLPYVYLELKKYSSYVIFHLKKSCSYTIHTQDPV